MRRLVIAAAAMAALCGGAYASPAPEPPDAPAPTDAKKEFDAAKTEYAKSYRAFAEAYRAAKTDEERQKAAALQPNPVEWSAKFKAIAEKSPKDPAAAECYAWIVQNDRTAASQAAALDALLANHLASPLMNRVCQSLEYSPAGNAMTFLRTVAEKSQDHEAQGRASYALARILNFRAGYAARAKTEPDAMKELEEWMGKEYADGVAGADAAALSKEAETLFSLVAEKYADIKYGNRTLGAKAKGDIYEMKNLVVGKAAPEIVGEDENGKAIKLSDFKGKVVLLDFWGFW